MPRPLLPFLCLAMFCQAATGQDSAPDSAFTKSAYNNAISYYHKYTDKQSRLYNGFLHIGYSHKIEGHAYFQGNEWQKGTVVYDGIVFPDVLMLYDLYKDELVIQHFHRLMLTLHNEKVKEFSFGNSRYIRFERDSTKKSTLATGFYQEMYKGNLIFLAKRQKILEETITDVLVQKFIPYNFYYVYKDNTWHNVKNWKDLKGILKEKSKEVRQHLRKNGIKFRKNKEQAILLAVQYIDATTK
jgi:hypothetical protein